MKHLKFRTTYDFFLDFTPNYRMLNYLEFHQLLIFHLKGVICPTFEYQQMGKHVTERKLRAELLLM